MEYSKHFLYPGALFTNKKPYLVNTILGSCVAICLWDPILSIGGINHFMLPLWNGEGLASPRYGNIATNKIIKNMEALGSLKRNLKAKVFGGAEVIATSSNHYHIGMRNVKMAEQLLAEHRITIVSSSVGGKQGRKIIYNTHTGEVLHRFIKSTTPNL